MSTNDVRTFLGRNLKAKSIVPCDNRILDGSTVRVLQMLEVNGRRQTNKLTKRQTVIGFHMRGEIVGVKTIL